MLARLRSLVPQAAAAGPRAPSAAPYAALPTTSESSLLPSASSRTGPSPPIVPFLALGAAVLLPWNLILSALPFFASLLATVDPLHASLPSTLSFLATGTNFVALAWITFSGSTSSSSSSGGSAGPGDGSRVVASIRRSLLALLLAFGAAELFVLLAPAQGQASGWTVALLAAWVLVLMLFGSYLQASVISFASLFGPKATGAVMAGQGGIAVLVSTVQVLSAVVASRSGKTGGDDSAGLKWPTFGFMAAGSAFQLYSLLALRQIASHPSHVHALSSSSHPELADALPPSERKPRSHVLDLFSRNALVNGAIALTFTITLAVFPAVTAAVAPVDGGGGWKELAIWVPIGFLTFNVGDFAGRALPSFALLRSARALFLFSLARALFVPFFLLCNTPSHSSSSLAADNLLPSAPLSNAAFLLGLLALGLSNGFVSACALIVGSTPALNARIGEDEKELAGTIAVFCLVGGLVLGSAASFGVVAFS